MTNQLEKYRTAIEALELSRPLSTFPEALLMRREGEWSTYYAPFEHVNAAARVVLVGITPGLQQACNALRALQAALRCGVPQSAALQEAKKCASFSGPMRVNLVALLDSIGLNDYLGICSTAELFEARSELVHYTSVLRYPVAYQGKNYSGTPRPVQQDFTRMEFRQWFAQEVEHLQNPVFIPLGPAVAEAVQYLADDGRLVRDRILEGLPHPSGANAERVAYFTRRKSRAALSSKVDPERLDRSRDALIRRVAAL